MDESFEVKLYQWVITLFQIYFATRPSEVCEYCPHVEDIKFPSKTNTNQWAVDGQPMNITIAFRDWKTRLPTDVMTGFYYMIIHRNELNMKFDLVYWLIRYLKQFNITHGPLFPQMTNDSKLVKSYAKLDVTPKGPQFRYFKVTVDSTYSDKPAYLKYTKLTEINKRVLGGAGYAAACNYTYRKSSAKWYSSLGWQDWAIRNGGRWKSISYLDYVQEGQYEYHDNPADDPIRKLWVWRPNTQHKALAPELVLFTPQARR